MKAQQLQDLNGPAGLKLVELGPPTPSDAVLIDVRAAGVTFPELLYTYGRYQDRPELPFVPGSEVAGIVKSAPPGSGFAAGDRVSALTRLGGWAEQAQADPSLTFALPAELAFVEAAALVVNYQTALFSLQQRGRLRAGESLLVHGAAGGLGTAGIQIGRGLGAGVIGCVSTAARAQVAAAAGATDVVLTTSDWRAQVGEITGGRGVDVVFDVVGGQSRFLDSLRCLAPGGRVVVAGFAGGEIPEVRVNRLLLTNTEIVGAAWGAYIRIDPDAPQRAHDSIMAMVQGGAVRPQIGHRLPLADAASALRLLESRAAMGKVILEP